MARTIAEVLHSGHFGGNKKFFINFQLEGGGGGGGGEQLHLLRTPPPLVIVLLKFINDVDKCLTKCMSSESMHM